MLKRLPKHALPWVMPACCFAAGSTIALLAPSSQVSPSPSATPKSKSTANSLSAERPLLHQDNETEAQQFAAFSLEKQIAALSKLKSRHPGTLPTQTTLLLIKMVRGLTADQTAALLQGLPKAVREDRFLKRALVEHLADQDLEKAVETGRRLDDPEAVGIAVATLAREDLLTALHRVSALSEKEWGPALSEMGSLWWGSRVGGDYAKVLDTLRSDSKLQDVFRKRSHSFAAPLAQLLAANSDKPAETLQTLLSIVPQFGDPNLNPQSFCQSVFQRAYQSLREKSPEAASAFVDRVPAWMPSEGTVGLEASSRFKSQGLESAIQYIEKQEREEATRNAASGLWTSLVQSDRSAAFAWINALPEGPVKEGVLMGVAQDAFKANGYDSKTFFESLISAAKTLPPEQHPAFYASVAKGMLNHSAEIFGHQSWQDFVDQVPLPLHKKEALIRVIAPLK